MATVKPRSFLRAGAALALVLAACGGSKSSAGPDPQPTAAPIQSGAAVASGAASAAPTVQLASVVLPADTEPPGDAVHGKKVFEDFECARCHEGTDTKSPSFEKQCFGCHVQIVSGKFKGPKGAEARWHDRVLDLQFAPSFVGSNKRFRRTWITNFILNPYDIRPRLGPTMPRLPLTREQARDVAAYLGMPDDPAAKPDFSKADPENGRKLMGGQGCPSCHVFSGAPKIAGEAAVDPKETHINQGLALAPDLRHTRDRWRPEAVIAWIQNAKAIKPDTQMPEYHLTAEQARDIAAFILLTPLEKQVLPAAAARLPVLDRPVKFDEVSEKVFRRTCWHCHGEPDYAAGDGGPGNTGGFGFKPRGVSFVDYGSVASGMVDEAGARHSLFEKTADGTPKIIKVLLARRDEEAGKADPALRGMPLGYSSLSPEDIQLVESWVAQGRPR